MIEQKSESTVYPLPIFKDTNCVYARSNVVEVERDSMGETVTIYQYDETVYSYTEYLDMLAEQNRADIDYVAIMTEVDL